MFTIVLVVVVLANIAFYGVCGSEKMDLRHKIAFWFAWSFLVLGFLAGVNLGLFGGKFQHVDLPGWFLVGALIAPFVAGPFFARFIDRTIKGSPES